LRLVPEGRDLIRIDANHQIIDVIVDLCEPMTRPFEVRLL